MEQKTDQKWSEFPCARYTIYLIALSHTG